MLVEFKVDNFKNFKDELTFSLDQLNNYEFNKHAINNGVVKTSLIYGPVGSGKSNLGLGIMDIFYTLSDKSIFPEYEKSFINLYNRNDYVKFTYKFRFRNTDIIYYYEKDSSFNLVKEELSINDKKYLSYNKINQIGEVNLKETENLKVNLKGENIPFVKYVYNNLFLLKDNTNQTFKQFMEFVSNMRIFGCAENNYNHISMEIIERNKLKEFEVFLKKVGIFYKLSVIDTDNQRTICCDFNGRKISFFNIASSGTKALALFYYLLLKFDKISLVYLDEFDILFHNKVAQFVVEELLKSQIQAIITTNNTSLINNNLLRPDCYFNLIDGKIRSFSNITAKELRKAHNLEKMYRSGVFDY